MAELANGMLSAKGKTKFISSVAAAIFRFKSLPTKEEYEQVAKEIISKYPFLRSSNGTGYVSYTYLYVMHYTLASNVGLSKGSTTGQNEIFKKCGKA